VFLSTTAFSGKCPHISATLAGYSGVTIDAVNEVVGVINHHHFCTEAGQDVQPIDAHFISDSFPQVFHSVLGPPPAANLTPDPLRACDACGQLLSGPAERKSDSGSAGQGLHAIQEVGGGSSASGSGGIPSTQEFAGPPRTKAMPGVRRGKACMLYKRSVADLALLGLAGSRQRKSSLVLLGPKACLVAPPPRGPGDPVSEFPVEAAHPDWQKQDLEKKSVKGGKKKSPNGTMAVPAPGTDKPPVPERANFDGPTYRGLNPLGSSQLD
jgi:hypothetical protein